MRRHLSLEENGAAIAAVCRRLDGLPLAIELAAARSKLFSPQALLARLDDRFQLLTGGARDLSDHQQTLRATIDWSYYLLNEEEQALFDRLAVFNDGRTVEVVEVVCCPGLGLSALAGLDSLRFLSDFGIEYYPDDGLVIEQYEADTKAMLDATTFARAWAEGQQMAYEEALDYALEEDDNG